MSERRAGPELSPELRVRALVAAFLIPPTLRVVSFQRVASRLERGWPRLSSNSVGFVDAALADFVDGILHRLPGPWRHTCLKRSAVLFHLLRSAGRSVELRIGVRRDDAGRLQAHAWLVKDGELYLESNPEMTLTHSVLARFPEAPGS